VLSEKAWEKLAEFEKEAKGYALVGLFIDPVSECMGTYSTHNLPPGAVLGLLKQAVDKMLDAAGNNELEFIGGTDAKMAGKAGEPIVH
jgi:hypothetical protein